MSISASAKHVMSAMLTVVIAFSGVAWASVGRTTHCMKPVEGCRHTAVITCCLPTAPTPTDRAPQLRVAPSPLHVPHAALVDPSVPPVPEPATGVPSPHWVRVLDLPVLLRVLVI
ncbi:MAG: hypothetical protein AB7H96_24870 [Vicinamibacterales bacterium]